MDFAHITVLLEEAVDSLLPERGGIFVDCTAGGGGHSEAILKRLPEGSRLISLDRDDRAIERCRERLAPYGDASTVVKTNYSEIGQVLDELGIDKIDGVDHTESAKFTVSDYYVFYEKNLDKFENKLVYFLLFSALYLNYILLY